MTGGRDGHEEDFADPGDPLRTGWLDDLLTADAGAYSFCLLCLSACCLCCPAAFLVSGLGMLVCRSPLARRNAVVLFVLAVLHLTVLWFAVFAPVLL